MGNEIAYNVLLSDEVDKFLDTLPLKAKAKILYNVRLVECGHQNIDIFKKLDGTDIWEFRTLYAGIQYRLLAFFDKDTNALIITTHGFIKKRQKTPLKEIDRAEAIRREYYNQKKG